MSLDHTPWTIDYEYKDIKDEIKKAVEVIVIENKNRNINRKDPKTGELTGNPDIKPADFEEISSAFKGSDKNHKITNLVNKTAWQLTNLGQWEAGLKLIKDTQHSKVIVENAGGSLPKLLFRKGKNVGKDFLGFFGQHKHEKHVHNVHSYKKIARDVFAILKEDNNCFKELDKNGFEITRELHSRGLSVPDELSFCEKSEAEIRLTTKSYVR